MNYSSENWRKFAGAIDLACGECKLRNKFQRWWRREGLDYAMNQLKIARGEEEYNWLRGKMYEIST